MATEKFANNAASTLNGAINSAVTSLTVTSATGFPTSGQFRVKIDTEILLVTAVAGSVFTVVRGSEGTTAASHLSGQRVVHVLTAAGLNEAIQESLSQFAYTVGPTGSSAKYITTGSNDEVQINQAITDAAAASPTLGIVHLFPGTYYLSAPVYMSSGTILKGSGAGITKLVVQDGTGPLGAGGEFSNGNYHVIGAMGNEASGTRTTAGTAVVLSADALMGGSSLVFVPTAESALVSVGDYLALQSEALWETTNLSGRKVGEYVEVLAVANGSGLTTLNGAISTTTATTFTVTSAASFPSAPFQVKVDEEVMNVTSVAGSVFTVTRGYKGTAAATHATLATVTGAFIVVSSYVRDDYKTSDTAKFYRISFVTDVRIEDLEIYQAAPIDTRGDVGLTNPPAMIGFSRVRRGTIRNCLLHHHDGPAITIYQSLDVAVSNNTIHDLTSNPGASRFGYGCLIGGASERVVVSGNTIGSCRHGIDAGPAKNPSGLGTSNYGIPRGVVGVGNTITKSTDAALSTHNEADGWEYIGNSVSNCNGPAINMRGRGSRVIGNAIEWCGQGINIGASTIDSQGGSAAGSHVIGNSMRYMKDLLSSGSLGVGITVALTDKCVIKGNIISECDRAGIQVRAATTHCYFLENTIVDCNLSNANGTVSDAISLDANKSGATADISAADGVNVTLHSASGNFSALLVGSTITVSGCATSANNSGTPSSFVVTAFIDTTHIQYSNAAGVFPDANSGSISFQIESITDNIFEGNTARNTPASDFARGSVGHMQSLIRDYGTVNGNERNTYRNNTGIGLTASVANLIRTGATTIYSAGNSITEATPVKTKAGAPVDADFLTVPQAGSLAVDTTNGLLYFRTLTTWTLASSGGFTAGGDLSGSTTSQQVIGLTGSGGLVNIGVSGSIALQYAAALTAASIAHAATSANAFGATMSMTAQGTTSTAATTQGGGLTHTAGSATGAGSTLNTGGGLSLVGGSASGSSGTNQGGHVTLKGGNGGTTGTYGNVRMLDPGTGANVIQFVPLATGATTISFTSAVTSVTFQQTTSTVASGATMQLTAQSTSADTFNGGILGLSGGTASGTTGTGGSVNVSAGTGPTAGGVINFRLGSTTAIAITPIPTGATVMSWVNTHTSVKLQISTLSSGTGAPFTVQAQNATTGTGGDLILSSGSGSVANGKLRLQSGSTDVMALEATTNIAEGTATGSYGSGVKVVYQADRTTAPSSNPTGGHIRYSESGVPYVRTSSGAVQSTIGSRISRAFPSDADYTAVQADYQATIMEFTGTISATRAVVLPSTGGPQWTVFNNTTGGQSITFKVTGQTGVTVPNGARAVVYANGTDIVLSQTLQVGMYTVGPAGSGAEFLTTGSGDESIINLAITACNAAGGGIVRLLPGTFTITNAITMRSNVHLQGSGAGATVIRIATGFVDASNVAAIVAQGASAGSVINLSSNLATGSNSISVTSNADYLLVRADDYLLLKSTALWEPTEQSGRTLGEFVKVNTTSTNSFTIFGMVRSTYNTADTATLQRQAFVSNIEISDLEIFQQAALGTRANPKPCISLSQTLNASVHDCTLHDNDQAGVAVLTSISTSVTNCDIYELTDLSASNQLGYAIQVGIAAEDTIIQGNRISRVRHGVTTGGGSFGVARNLTIVGNVVSHCTNTCIDTHNQSENVLIAGNTLGNSDTYGIYTRGRSTRIIGNAIEWCGAGISVGISPYQVSGGSGSGTVISGNSIRNIKFGTWTSLYVVTGSGVGIQLTVTDDVRVVDNTIENCDGYGIQLSAKVSNSLIQGNKIFNCNLQNDSVTSAIVLSAGISTTAASITTVVGSTVTLTYGGTSFANYHVGSNIVITGAASAANNGTFPITAVPGTNSLQYTNAAGVASDANNGSISGAIENITDNWFVGNVAGNTPASNWDPSSTGGHSRYFVRDTGVVGAGGNVRNVFKNNSGFGMVTQLFSQQNTASFFSGNSINEGTPLKTIPTSPDDSQWYSTPEVGSLAINSSTDDVWVRSHITNAWRTLLAVGTPFDATLTNPTISQATSSTGTGVNFSISPQSSSAVGGNGGSLFLNAGSPGSGGTQGSIRFALGSSTAYQITPNPTGANTISVVSGGTSVTYQQSSTSVANGATTTLSAQATSFATGSVVGGTLSLIAGNATGASTSNTGGTLSIAAGNATTGTSNIGGALNLSAGSGSTTNGAINFRAGGVTFITFLNPQPTGAVDMNWISAITAPRIVHATLATGDGSTFILQAQNTSSGTGGDLALTSGTGTVTTGKLRLRYGGTDGFVLDNGFITMKTAWAETAIISPTALTGSTNNYNPTGLATARVIRQNCTATAVLTGLTAQPSGQRVTLHNIATVVGNELTLSHEDASSTAANRFTLPGLMNLIIQPGGSVEFWYDTTTSRWRVIGEAGLVVIKAAAGTGFVLQGASMTSGSATLTLNGFHGTTPFTAADAGKAIQVVGAGASGADLYTTISTFTNATTVTLANTAGTTITKKTALWYTVGQDDTARIQAAIDGANTTNGDVRLSSGVFIISSTLNTSQFLKRFSGTSMNETFIATSSTSFSGNMLSLSSETRATTVENLTFKHRGPSVASANSIITAWSATSNVVTFTATNAFVAGQIVRFTGFIGTGAPFNDSLGTINASGLSGSQFAVNFTIGNGSGTDTGGAHLDENCIYISIDTNTPIYANITNLMLARAPGDGLAVASTVVTKVTGCVALENRGNGFAIYLFSAIGSTSTQFDTCYANGNQQAGYYIHTLVYGTILNCAADSNGISYYLYSSRAVTLTSCGSEDTGNRSAAFPGYAYYIHGGRGITLNSCYAAAPSVANLGGTFLVFDNSTTACAAYNMTFNGSSNLPTVAYSIASGCTGITVWEPNGSTIAQTAWTNSGFNNTIYYNGQLQSSVDTLDNKSRNYAIALESTLTADATPTVIYTFPSTNNHTYVVKGFITVQNTGSNGYGYYEVNAFFNRNTTLVLLSGSPVTTLLESDPTMDLQITASGTNIILTATGVAASNRRWTGNLTIHEGIF